MVAAVFDTNILIDHLNGVEQARREIRRFSRQQISVITWMEVLVGIAEELEAPTRSFLQRFELLGIDAPVAERAIQIRRSHRLKLPDALIWATAEVHASVLVTRNTKDFHPDDPSIRIPYELR